MRAFFSLIFAAALSMVTIAADAASQSHVDAASGALNQPENMAVRTAAHSAKFERSPNSCGGVPAPRLTPADGYFTVCVNDKLRFVNNADQYNYTFTAIRLKNGKETERSEIAGISQLGMPVLWSTGTELPYLSSLKTDRDTGKTTATYENGFSGVTLLLDAATRQPDGTLIADVAVEDTSLLALDTLAHVPGYPDIQGARTRTASVRETLVLTPGQAVTLHSENLEVRLTATKVAQ